MRDREKGPGEERGSFDKEMDVIKVRGGLSWVWS
jgi:hypothetical protein